MATIYYDKDADLELTRRQEGRDHRLRQPGPRPRAEPASDSGVDVRRRAARRRAGRGAKAEADGPHASLTPPKPPKWADIIMILAPDTAPGRSSTARTIAPHLTPGKTLMFAHGFNIRFGHDRCRRRTWT